MLKKRTLAAVLAVLMLTLCACAPGAQTPADTAAQPTTQAPTQTDGSAAFEMPAEYDALLQALVKAFPNVSGLEEYPGLSKMYDGHTSLTELGYALADVDTDGTPELLLKSLESPFVYDVFTLTDGRLTQLLSGGEHDSYRLYEEGLVEAQWLESETVKGTDYYRVENGTLVLFDRIAMDAEHAASLGLVENPEAPDTDKCFFRSATDKKEDYTSITATEALSLQQNFKEDNFHLLPQFVPLSDYRA